MTAPDRTHYDVLGIARDADAAAVRSAWKLHVQAWHPDRFSGEMREEAERQTSRINEAYTTLRDGSRRAAYDCRLAADELGARAAAAPPRRATKTHPVAPRASTAPIGSPMTLPVPMTLGEQAAAAASDALAMLRRHPRITAAAVAAWVFVFGGSMVMHAVSGPTLPASATAAPVASVVADDAQIEDLEDLAARARAEAAQDDAEMQQLMREDAALAAAEARAAARADALARRAAKKRRSSAAPAARAAAAAPTARRIVRVMPRVG